MSSIRLKTDLTDVLIPWLKALYTDFEVPVIIERPNQVRPLKTYLSVRISTPLQRQGSNDSIVHKTGDTFEISGQRRLGVSITCHMVKNSDTMDIRNDFFTAQDLLAQVQDACENPLALETLNDAGIAVWSAGDILDLTELVESGFESRAQIDLVIGLASNRDVDLGYIDSVEFVGTVEGDDEPVVTVNG
jgi:hypothetical protein